ncbi:MAG: sigma-70 family RNA polymerase sigma factor [Chloroflexi bacterium]|nr:sigma-70 family RNA polymerase sigma factor [Chloroflexota bacterium]
MRPTGSDRARPDAQILTDLYEELYDRVARYVTARTGSRDLGEDLAAEVFVRAVESIGSFRDRGAPIEAWLFRIAHNLVVDHYRRSTRRPAVVLDDAMQIAGSADTAAEVEQRLAMERVRQMMEHLNQAQQEVISLRFSGQLSAEETGAVMGRTPGAVRELQRTALKALRALMVPGAAHPEAPPHPEDHGPSQEAGGR